MAKKQSNDIKDYNHVDLLYPSKYLKGADLRGRDVTVTIEMIEPRHELARTDNTKEAKPLMRFRGADKGLVLNKTNAKTIASIYGMEVLRWIGQPITLYSAKVSAFGAIHDAVRVRPQRPKQRQNPQPDNDPPPVTDDDLWPTEEQA